MRRLRRVSSYQMAKRAGRMMCLYRQSKGLPDSCHPKNPLFFYGMGPVSKVVTKNDNKNTPADVGS